MSKILKGSEGVVRIRREGAVVLMEINGKAMAIPWEAAQMLGRHLIREASLAEEHAKAEQVIFDNALLHRIGAPFGFSRNPDIIRETVKEATWNRDLRRYLPGEVKARDVVYPPIVKKNKKEQNNGR